MTAPNESIQRLTDSVVEALMRQDLQARQLRQAMQLAYEGGRIDGNLELANKILAKPTKPEE